MRKVFISIMYGQKMPANEYVSDDFELHGKQYMFPLTYLVANNIQKGDNVLVLTSVEVGNNQHHQSRDNYERYKNEVRNIGDSIGANIEFQEIWTKDEFTVKTGREFFKSVAQAIEDGDRIYADLTFGIKIFSISAFIALAYVARANVDVDVQNVIYAWKYSSAISAIDAKKSKIYDVTSLFYLNQMAGKLSEGDRTTMDKLLGI